MDSFDPVKYTEDDAKTRTTHFGFRQVPVEAKASMVAAVFDFLPQRSSTTSGRLAAF